MPHSQECLPPEKIADGCPDDLMIKTTWPRNTQKVERWCLRPAQDGHQNQLKNVFITHITLKFHTLKILRAQKEERCRDPEMALECSPASALKWLESIKALASKKKKSSLLFGSDFQGNSKHTIFPKFSKTIKRPLPMFSQWYTKSENHSTKSTQHSQSEFTGLPPTIKRTFSHLNKRIGKDEIVH